MRTCVITSADIYRALHNARGGFVMQGRARAAGKPQPPAGCEGVRSSGDPEWSVVTVVVWSPPVSVCMDRESVSYAAGRRCGHDWLVQHRFAQYSMAINQPHHSRSHIEGGPERIRLV